MKKPTININKGGYHYEDSKNSKTKFFPFPDVRPLTERTKHRTASKKFDPLQMLLLDNSQRNCTGYIPD